MNGKKWTKSHINKIIELYPKASWEELMQAFPDRSRVSLMRKATKLGLIRQAVNWLTEKSLILEGYELGWLVAFTEGEGHFGVYHPQRGGYHPHIFWGNTEKVLTDHCEEIIGYHNHQLREYVDTPGHKVCHRLVVRELDMVRQVMELLEPHLIGKKKRQAQLILELIQIKAQTPQSRWKGRDSRQEEIYREVRALNKRGP